MRLAIFDLDNTLLAGDSDHAWGEFLCQHNVVDVDEYRAINDQFFADYQKGNMDIEAYLSFALAPLKQLEAQKRQQLQLKFMQTCVEPMILPSAEALLSSHREQGDFLLIITATNRFITEPIAQRLNVDDLLATDPEIIDENFTGRIQGTPCYQEGKVVRLKKWLSQHKFSLEDSYFYSDSINDLPLLETVTHPIAVNPDPQLKAIADARQWDILMLN